MEVRFKSPPSLKQTSFKAGLEKCRSLKGGESEEGAVLYCNVVENAESRLCCPGRKAQHQQDTGDKCSLETVDAFIITFLSGPDRDRRETVGIPAPGAVSTEPTDGVVRSRLETC